MSILTTSVPNLECVRFLYVRDPENHFRVLSIVRSVDLDNMVTHFQYCVNRPPDWFVSRGPRGVERMHLSPSKSDMFSRQRARQICLGRLATNPIAVSLLVDRPIAAIMKHLADDSNKIVSRIAKDWLSYHAENSDSVSV
jgi:hypothetical protein